MNSNGKVERSHWTDLDEFYCTVDLNDSELDLRLAEWECYYNWYRPPVVGWQDTEGSL